MSREVRLKPECATLYPMMPKDRWEPACIVVERLVANLLRERAPYSVVHAAHRLDPRHFDFRNGVASPVTIMAPPHRKPSSVKRTGTRLGANLQESATKDIVVSPADPASKTRLATIP